MEGRGRPLTNGTVTLEAEGDVKAVAFTTADSSIPPEACGEQEDKKF